MVKGTKGQIPPTASWFTCNYKLIIYESSDSPLAHEKLL